MAKAKGKKQAFQYNAEVKQLKETGPERLYLLYGPEEYLRERYLEALRDTCVPAEDTFSYHRLEGASLDLGELAEAVNALPFFTERSFVEVRDYNLNKCRDAEWERLKGICADVPEWCTLAFVQSAENTPDGRLTAVKGLKKLGKSLEFTEQDAAALAGWVANRFRALGKGISRGDAEYLLFLAGTRMNGLIPEIEKAAAFAAGDSVTRGDLDATVNRLPEADVWALTDLLGARRFDEAAGLLSDLLGSRDNHPILLNALISQQLRRMYACKAGQAAGRSRREIMELCGVRFDFIYEKLAGAAKPYSLGQLGALVDLCVEYDYRMKSTGMDPAVLLRELFARIAAGG